MESRFIDPPVISVTEETCSKCGLCVKICPTRIYKLAEFLKIPEGHKCYAAMTAGFPSINLHSIPERKVDITWINDSNSLSL